MDKVILFGVLDLAELAHYYLTHDSAYEVVGFTVHSKYIKSKEFKGLPVIPFENVENVCSPNDYKLFAPMTAKKMNTNRAGIYEEGKRKGYDFVSYISSKATVCSNEIGENCFILEDNTLQPFTKVGNDVVLWSGNHIGHHGEIKDHVFFTSHVVMSGHCIIEPYCFFGVNSTIRDNCHVEKGTLLAMGASLTAQSTDEWGVYIGNPAKRKEKIKSIDIF